MRDHGRVGVVVQALEASVRRRVIKGTEEGMEFVLNGVGVDAREGVAAVSLEVVVIAESKLRLGPLVGSGGAPVIIKI